MYNICDIDLKILSIFNGSGSDFIDAVSLTLTSGVIWIPLYVALLYVIIKNSDTMLQIALTTGCALLCVAITSGVSELLVKPLVARLRPCNDPMIKLGINVIAGTCPKGYSFFSSHAANTFGLATYFSCLFRSRLLTVSLVLWSLVNCWTRLYLGVHYPSDIVCGLLFGALIGFSAYLFYRKIYLRMFTRHVAYSSRYTKSGYYVADIDIIMNVLAFILCFVLIKAMIVQ